MNTQIHQKVTISPEVWPSRELDLQPGDLSQFVLDGLGLSGPFPFRPWDKLDRPNPGQFYGFEPHSSHPILGAPLSTPAGGTIYFSPPSEERLLTVAKVMDIRLAEKQYAVFHAEPEVPVEERYLVQLRIVSRFAMSSIFHAVTSEECENFVDQPLTVGELLWQFTQDQLEVWGDGMSRQLRRKMGGDGDWAKESLCFGMFVENSYHGVYRIWSRAWLVTK